MAELRHFHHADRIVEDGVDGEFAVGDVDGVAAGGGEVEAFEGSVCVVDCGGGDGGFVSCGVGSLFEAFGWGGFGGEDHEDGGEGYGD